MSNTATPSPIPTTKIITLLEENKINEQDDPGTFSLNLAEEIVLKEGDSLNVSSIYVDTTTEGTNFIEVDNDETEITITTGLYLTDQETIDPVGGQPPWFKGSVELGKRPDARKYILQNQSEAFLNTFFDWESDNNQHVTGGIGPIDDFAVQLDTTIAPAYQGYGFQYTVIAEPQPGPAGIAPPAPNYNLQQEYMVGGHMILVSNITEFEFHYYPVGWTPAGGVINPNDHTAVITRWVEGGVIKGWKVKKNPLRPPFANPNRNWLFASDADGYNYFGDDTKKHLVSMTGIKMPINKKWRPASESAPHQFPAVEISWNDGDGNPQTQRAEFSNYPPTYGPSPFPDAGVQDLINFGLGGDNIPFKEPTGGGDFVPDNLQGKKNGWPDGSTNPSWEWFNFDKFIDPRDGKNIVWEKLIFNVDDPPYITFYYPGVDTAFVNTSSQYYDPEKKGMKAIPWQLTTTPVVNPESSGSRMVPRTYDTTFSILPGKYTYSALAQAMTDALNEIPRNGQIGLSNNPSDPTHPVNYPGLTSGRLLTSSYELMMQYDGYGAANIPTFPNNYVFSGQEVTVDGVVIPAKGPLDQGFQPYFISEDGVDIFQFNTNELFPSQVGQGLPPRLIGAQSFSVIFDESSQTFQIGQAHSNIYVPGEAAPGGGIAPPGPQVVKQIKVADPTNADTFFGKLKIADTASGVFITSMQPESLFFGKNKMNMNKRILTSTHQSDTTNRNFEQYQDFTGEQRLTDVQTHPITLSTGQNITGFFVGTDALVNKNASFANVNTGWNEFIEATTPVTLSGDPIIQVSDDQPYYQIEISGINSQDIYLPDSLGKNNLIQAYCGKYYSAGAFTQSSAPGFEYTHKGNPKTIKSLRVRILDTQGVPQVGLGNHTAIVLELNTNK